MDDHASYVYHVHKPNDEIRLVINKSETRGYKKKGRKKNKTNKTNTGTKLTIKSGLNGKYWNISPARSNTKTNDRTTSIKMNVEPSNAIGLNKSYL